MTNNRDYFTLQQAKQMDIQDELAHYRNEFYIKEESIYFDGNSLGLLSKRAEKTLLELLESWKNLGIDGWTSGSHPWFYLSETLGAEMAPLVGANREEVIVTGSTSINLHQLVATLFQPDDKRNKILADELAFPSDIYALQSQLKLKGLDPETHLVKVKSDDGHTLDEQKIIEAMEDDIALIVLPSILYRSGQILNMKRLTEEAHQRGIMIGFDLCHSVGSMAHELSDWDVDFAFWCTYKHLNGGPGSVGALYVNQKHFGTMPGLAGWFSSRKDKQFDMAHELIHEEHAGAYQIGTPHVLSIAPLIGALSMFNEIGMTKIREKSLKLTKFLLDLINERLNGYGFLVRNPVDDTRGGHIFLEHKEAARICKALKDNGVVPDYRSPNGIRLAPVALYNSFEEVYKTVDILKRIMDEELYKKYENKRGVVA